LGGEPLLVAIVGPTGSGKTALSIAIARSFHGEIVNCDSVAMHREFDIGTAKPTAEERGQAPHHLLDAIAATGYTTAGEYARKGREMIHEIHARGALAIVVGGTGLYLKALLEGLFPGPQRSEELRKRLRERAEQKGAGHLHRLLQRLDSASARKIHPNDVPKVIRAIEVSLEARRPMSEQWQAGRNALGGFRVLRIGLDPERAELYRRINHRVEEMFESGLVEETRGLLTKYGEAARPLGSIGYKQVVQMLRGELSREAAVGAVQQAHRNYAKRQMTWFRREPEVKWFAGFGDDEDLQRQVGELVRASL
jgi:tRNA dimethylallyltransferase